MISQWSNRPLEVAHLLNPAFCSIVLRESILGYEEEAENGMPFPLSFLVLPMVLHKPTREILPKSIATKFHSWVHKNQSVRVGFDMRARQLVPYTKEAIHFATQLEMLSFSEHGQLNAPKRRNKGLGWLSDSEPEICKKKARLVGRWFTRAGDPATIYAILGVKP